MVRLKETNIICLLESLLNGGDEKYLNKNDSDSYQINEQGNNSVVSKIYTKRKILMVFIALLIIGGIVLLIYEFSCNYNVKKVQYNGEAGLSVIGILAAACFMVFSILYTNKLFSCSDTKQRNEVYSLFALTLISQLILTGICFIDIIISNYKDYFLWISIWLQIGTVIFMIITDINLIMHLSSLYLSPNYNLNHNQTNTNIQNNNKYNSQNNR